MQFLYILLFEDYSFFSTIKEFTKEFGILKGTAVLFFWLAHWYIRHLYLANIKGKQEEINRMAESLKEFREENKELRNELKELYKEKRS